MTPYEIEVLMHYYTRPTDHPDATRNPPVWLPTFQSFLTNGLLERTNDLSKDVALRISERGVAYCEALQMVPLPVQQTRWLMSWPEPEIRPR